MEKIAILTHCVANNYGANLQALSTASYLRKNGYEAVFIQWDSYLEDDTPSIQQSIHKNFLSSMGFTMSEPLKTDEDFYVYIKNQNIKRIIVGSDCVLTYKNKSFPYRLTRKGFIRKKELKDYSFPNPFWLDYIKNEKDIKRCLMSASCGGMTSMKIRDDNVRNSMAELLGKYDYISVRDSFTKKYLREMLPSRSDVSITPDPVFGFNSNVKGIPSEDVVRQKFNLPEKYFVICFYGFPWPEQKWADALMTESHKYGIQCVSVPMPQGGRNSHFDKDIDLPLNPLDWYSIIKYSKGYIGHNMHPVIVSLHNNVPFFSYSIHGRSFLHGRIQLLKTSKEYDLLSRFGLQDNLVSQPHFKFISPKTVVERVLSFDFEKCRRASATLQEEYNHMMSDILNTLR